MPDPTEQTRRMLIEGGQPLRDLAVNAALERPTWDTEALKRDFKVLSFAAPFVVVQRLSDGVMGTLEFTHNPRTYFNWEADDA
jgi:hypothetical protein